VVAEAASRAVVLNAEDENCVAIGAGLEPQVERIYFSCTEEHPVLQRHLENGGRAVYLTTTARSCWPTAVRAIA
jgi:cyanophycin synthetase